MKRLGCCVVLALAAVIPTVAMAVESDNIPRCRAELKREDGTKITAYFLSSDCVSLKNAKRGETVRMVGPDTGAGLISAPTVYRPVSKTEMFSTGANPVQGHRHSNPDLAIAKGEALEPQQ